MLIPWIFINEKKPEAGLTGLVIFQGRTEFGSKDPRPKITTLHPFLFSPNSSPMAYMNLSDHYTW